MKLQNVVRSTWRGWLLAGLACGLSACVTINIYFPAAAAEKAADKIIDEVWQHMPKKSDANGNQEKTDTNKDVK